MDYTEEHYGLLAGDESQFLNPEKKTPLTKRPVYMRLATFLGISLAFLSLALNIYFLVNPFRPDLSTPSSSERSLYGEKPITGLRKRYHC